MPTVDWISVARLPQIVVGLVAISDYDALEDDVGLEGGISVHVDMAVTHTELRKLGVLRHMLSVYLDERRQHSQQQQIMRLTLLVRRANLVAVDVYQRWFHFTWHSTCAAMRAVTKLPVHAARACTSRVCECWLEPCAHFFAGAQDVWRILTCTTWRGRS